MVERSGDNSFGLKLDQYFGYLISSSVVFCQFGFQVNFSSSANVDKIFIIIPSK